MPIYLPEVTASSTGSLTPRQIVAELDKYVVGQKQAKRAVAIALRNRIRRQRLELLAEARRADLEVRDQEAEELVPLGPFEDIQVVLEDGTRFHLRLRVFVQGGGCSGFQYGFTFVENLEEGDIRVENGGVTLLIDPMSIQYLAGAEIDYREDIEGAQFVIRNPNAQTTCGCGSSFSM